MEYWERINSTKFAKKPQNYCREKATFLVKRCCGLFTLWFPANTSLNQSYAGNQFDTMYLVNAGGRDERKPIVVRFVWRYMFLVSIKISVI